MANVNMSVVGGFDRQVATAFRQHSEDFMVADLARGGLDPNDIFGEAMEGPPAMRKAEWVLAAYKIPYITPDGNIHPHMWRAKLQWKPHITKADLEKEGLHKYMQPNAERLGAAGIRGNYPYMPVGGVGDVMVICEGEKKAAGVLNRFKCPVLGTQGAWGWSAERGSGDVHPELLACIRRKKPTRIIVAADCNFPTNAQVRKGWTGLYMRLEALFPEIAFSIVALDTDVDDYIVANEDYTFEDYLEESPVDEGELQMSRDDLVERFGLSVQANGGIVNNHHNIKTLVERHPLWAGQIQRNLDTGHVEIYGKEWNETNHSSTITSYINSRLGILHAGLSATKDAIIATAEAHAYSPLTDEINAQEWDGVRRAKDIFGFNRSANEQAISESFVFGYVKRILFPGCDWPVMVIISGKPGIGKSSMARWLCGPHGSVVAVKSGEMRNIAKDTAIKLLSSNVAVFDDIDTLSRADEGQLKSMVTLPDDQIRKAYGREAQTYRRRGIMMGTSNHADVLPYDPTGNRRFVVIECLTLDNEEWLKQWRLQILAEVKEMVLDGAAPVIDFKAMEQYYDKDPLADAAEEFVSDIKAGDKAVLALMLPLSATKRRFFKATSFWLRFKGMNYVPRHDEKKRLGGYFRALGLIYQDNNVMRLDGKPIRKVWEVV